MSSASPLRKSVKPSRANSSANASSRSLSGKAADPQAPRGTGRATSGNKGRHTQAPGKLRIIGGQWRRRLLPIAPVEGLRPTPDRVRETLFNWLGQRCEGWQVLDAFAGTGALGLEAASRGAAFVQFVENNTQALAQLRENALALNTGTPPVALSFNAGSVADFLRRDARRYDLVFLDPPFHSDWLERVLPQIMQRLAPNGLLYVEWHQPLANDVALSACIAQGGMDIVRADKAGQVHYYLLRCKTADDYN